MGTGFDLDDAITVRESISQNRIDCDGGYHDDIDTTSIPGYVVIATLDPAKAWNAPMLEVYKTQRFIEEMKQEAQAAENYG